MLFNLERDLPESRGVKVESRHRRQRRRGRTSQLSLAECRGHRERDDRDSPLARRSWIGAGGDERREVHVERRRFRHRVNANGLSAFQASIWGLPSSNYPERPRLRNGPLIWCARRDSNQGPKDYEELWESS